jgi:hypothetical protein
MTRAPLTGVNWILILNLARDADTCTQQNRLIDTCLLKAPVSLGVQIPHKGSSRIQFVVGLSPTTALWQLESSSLVPLVRTALSSQANI